MKKDQKSKVKKHVTESVVTADVVASPGTAQTELASSVDSQLSAAEATKITLSPEIGDKIKKFEENILKTKLQLAELVVSKENILRQEKEAIQSIKSNSLDMMALIKKSALQNGINPDGADGNKWNFDTSTMTFTKVQ